jgi:CRP/FNR family transcriptional regulator, cyclic AMP receptor protein
MSSQTDSPEVKSAPRSEAPLWYDWKTCLGNVKMFSELSSADLKRVSRLAEARFCRDGSVIIRAGSSTDSRAFFAVVEGRARVQTPSGHTRMLETNESFGELALLDAAPRSATVSATGDTRLACIRGAAFRRLLRDDPSVASAVLRSLVATVRDIQDESAGAAEDTGRLSRGGAPVHSEFGEDWSLLRDDAVRILATVPLFQTLSKKHLRRIAAWVRLHTHPDGSVVVTKGAPGGYFHIIVDGMAHVVATRGDSTLGPGDYFGELALVDGAPRSAQVIAEGTLTTLQISRTSFSSLLREEPAVTLGLIQGLVVMIRSLQQPV